MATPTAGDSHAWAGTPPSCGSLSLELCHASKTSRTTSGSLTICTSCGEYGYRTRCIKFAAAATLPAALMAAVYTVVGSESLQAVRLVQIVLSLMTCVLVYYLGRLDLLEPRTGLWAAGVFAFYPRSSVTTI